MPTMVKLWFLPCFGLIFKLKPELELLGLGEVYVAARPSKSIQNKWGLTLRQTSTI